MRLFFMEWGADHKELVDLVEDLKNQGHEIVYWARSNCTFEIDQSRFPGTIFHDYFDSTAGKPAPGVDDSQFLPLGEDFIKKFLGYESELITMMNKKYEWMSVSQRKHLYYHFLWYWKGVIEKYKPELIIFPMATHTLYDFVLYGLAEYYQIPTLMFDISTIIPNMLLVNSFESGCPALVEEMKRIECQEIFLSDLSPDLQKYFLKHTSDKADDPPDYLKKNINEYSSFKNWFRIKSNMIWVAIKDLSIFKKTVNYIYKKLSPDLRDEYLRVQIEPDFDKKFIFVALHYQPECATSPLGGVFVDQILMIEILSAALSNDWVIYVKEHPLQWHPRGKNFTSYRYKGYYEHVAKIKNVFIVPAEINGYTMINKCQAVATVTGSSGWEGALRLKPALVFGYAWYRECPGIFRVKNVDSCKEALRHIVQGNIIKHEDVIKYLYAFDQVSIKGYLSNYCQQVSGLSPKENKENILNAFLVEIKKIENSK